MSDWIELDENLNKGVQKPFKGVNITVYLSPFDAPKAVRGKFDTELGRFVIEFRYLKEEDWTRTDGNEPITFRVGKVSKRLCGIEVDVKRLRAPGVALTIEAMTDQLRERLKSLAANPDRRAIPENYKLAENLLGQQDGPARSVLEGLLTAAS